MTAGADRKAFLATLCLMVVGGVLLATHVARYPVDLSVAFDTSRYAPPDPSKLLSIVRTLLALGAINLCAMAMGGLFERVLPFPQALARFRLPLRLGIGFGGVSLGVLALAATKALSWGGFGVLLAVPTLGWVALERRRLLDVGVGLVPSRATWGWIALTAVLLGIAFVKVFGPDVGWDALTYHLAFPERYLDANGIVMTPFSHLSGYIAVTEMLYVLALFLDGPELAVAIHFEFGALILWVLWVASSRVSPLASVLALLFLVADPLFQTELAWAYNDLALGFFAIVTAFGLAELSSTSDSDERAKLLRVLGVACGMCVSIRYLGAGVGIIACLMIAASRSGASPADRAREVLTLAGVASLVVAPWLVRNTVFTGNPVTPLFQSLFHASGQEFIPAIVMQQSAQFLREVGMGRDLAALVALPWNLTMESQPGSYSDSFGFRVTVLHLIGLLSLPLLYFVGRRPKDVSGLPTVLWFTACFVLFWFFSFQEARFLLPVFPLFAYAGAVGFAGLIPAAGISGKLLLLLPAIAILHTSAEGLRGLPEAYGVAIGRSGTAPLPRRAAEAAADWARSNLTEGDRLLLWMEQRAYLFRDLDYIPYHIGSGAPTLAFVHVHSEPDSLHCALAAMDVTHVLVNRNVANRVQPGLFVSGYTQDDFLADRGRVNRLLSTRAEKQYDRDGIELHRLSRADCR